MIRKLAIFVGLFSLFVLAIGLGKNRSVLPAISPVHAAANYGDVMPISWTDIAQGLPDLVYNPDADEFLVVWHGTDNNGPQRIFAARVKPDGTVLSQFVIFSQDGDDFDQPSAAYDPVNQRYLVTYSRDVDGDGSNWDLYGSLIIFLPNGAYTLSKDPFLINSWATHQWESQLAYNSLEDRFLVVWTNEYQDNLNPLYISGVPIEFDAAGNYVVGNTFSINGAEDHIHADVAYNQKQNEFFLIYEKNDGAGAIYGRRLTNTGSLTGNEIGIQDLSSPLEKPAIAYCPQSDQYFATWQDRPQGKTDVDIYGRIISSNGDVGKSGAVSNLTGIDELDPSVACSAQGDQFFVVWLQETAVNSPNDTWGREVSWDGGANLLLEPAFLLGSHNVSATEGNSRPAVAPGGVGFLVVWEHELTSQTTGIFGRMIANENLFLPYVTR